MKKLALLIAVAVGYVLGARAGRKRYEQIVARARSVWQTEPVQHTVDAVTDAAKSAASDTGHVVAGAASSAGAKLSDVAEGMVDRVRATAETTAEDDEDPADVDPLAAAVEESEALAAETSDDDADFIVPTAEDFADEVFDDELSDELTETVSVHVSEVEPLADDFDLEALVDETAAVDEEPDVEDLLDEDKGQKKHKK